MEEIIVVTETSEKLKKEDYIGVKEIIDTETDRERDREEINFIKKYNNKKEIEIEIKEVLKNKNLNHNKDYDKKSVTLTLTINENSEDNNSSRNSQIISLPEIHLETKNPINHFKLDKIDHITGTGNKKSNSFTLRKNKKIFDEFSLQQKKQNNSHNNNNNKSLLYTNEISINSINSINSIDIENIPKKQKNNSNIKFCKKKFRNKKSRENTNDCKICHSRKENPFILPCCNEDFCLECIKYYISSQLNEYQLKIPSNINTTEFKIKCPNSNCTKFFQKDFLTSSEFLDENSKIKYFKALEIIRIKNIPGHVFCPFPDCDSFAIKNSANFENFSKKILICEKNKHEFCLNCLKPYHKNKCKVEEIISHQEAKLQKIKKCPKCQFLIQKIDGCNHMTCKNIGCDYQFCWLCMKEYSKTHYENPLSTCYRRSNDTQELNFLNRNKFFIFLKRFCLIVLLLILFILSAVFSSFVFAIIFGNIAFIDRSSVAYFIMSKSPWLNKLNNFIRIWFLVLMAIGYISLGFIISSLVILTSPMWLSVLGCYKLVKWARLYRRQRI
jgi:ariadne-1